MEARGRPRCRCATWWPERLTHESPFEIIAFQKGEEVEGCWESQLSLGFSSHPGWRTKFVLQTYRSPLEPANRLVSWGQTVRTSLRRAHQVPAIPTVVLWGCAGHCGGLVDIPGPSPLSCDKPPPPPHPQTLPGPLGAALTAGDPSASWDGSWVGLQPGAQEPGGAGTGTDPRFHLLLPCIPKLHPLPGAFSKSRLMLTLCLIAVFFLPLNAPLTAMFRKILFLPRVGSGSN